MAFLSAIGKMIVSAILSWVAKAVTRFFRHRAEDKQAEEKAKDSVKPLKEAKTADEIDKATDGALDGF